MSSTPSGETKSPALGRATLVVSLALLGASIAASVVNGVASVPFVDTEGLSYSVSQNSNDPSEVALAGDLQEHWIFGLITGVAVFTIGIMAAVSRRGRAAGVLASVIVFLTPLVSLVTFVAVIASSL